MELAGGDPSESRAACPGRAPVKGRGHHPKGVQQLVKVGKVNRLRIRMEERVHRNGCLAQADDDAKKELKRLAAELEAILDGAQ